MAGINKPETMNAKQGLLEINKKEFVRALKRSPRREAENNRPLRHLVIRFRYELGNCTDEIPCNLERFGFHRRITFAYLINEVIGSHL